MLCTPQMLNGDVTCSELRPHVYPCMMKIFVIPEGKIWETTFRSLEYCDAHAGKASLMPLNAFGHQLGSSSHYAHVLLDFFSVLLHKLLAGHNVPSLVPPVAGQSAGIISTKAHSAAPQQFMMHQNNISMYHYILHP